MSAIGVLGRDGIIGRVVTAADDRGAAVLGPPGSGLSSLLQAVTAEAREGGRESVLVRFPDVRCDPSDRPDVLLIVDDAHLGTDAQLLALRDRALIAPVVVGARTGAADEQLSWLWRSGGVVRFEIEPLGDDAIVGIVEHHAHGPVHRTTLDGILYRAGGRPGFAVDETESLIAEGRLSDRSGVLCGRLTGQVGKRLIERARELLTTLPVGLATMLEKLAMAGSVHPRALVALDIDLPELESRDLVGRFDHASGTRVRLVPPALAAAIRATIPPRRAAEMAQLLLSSCDDLELDDRARLLLMVGEAVGLDELTAAARSALRNDRRIEALQLARQVASFGADGEVVEAEILVALGGRVEAGERYAAILALDGLSLAVRARAAIEYSLILMWDLGRPSESVAVASDLAAAMRDGPFTALAEVHLALLTLYAGRPADALALTESVDVESLDDQARAGHTLIELISRGMVDPADADPTGGMWLIDGGPSGFERGVAVAAVALSHELLGEYSAADAVIGRARSNRPDADTPASLGWSLLAGARAELAVGRHELATRVALESAAIFDEISHRSGRRWAVGAWMLAAAIGGDRVAVRDAVELFDRLEDGVPFLDADLLRARAWAAWVLGNSESAATYLRDAAECARLAGAVTLEAVALHDAFRLLHAPVLQRLAELAERFPVPSIILRARHVELFATGDAPRLLDASADLESLGALLLAAEVAADAARIAEATGMRSLARTAVGQRVRLAALCGDPATPGLSDHGPVNLTARERDVVTLAIDGSTSRRIADELGLSTRTVDNLLQRAYVKLGVHGRAELAERMAMPGGVATL